MFLNPRHECHVCKEEEHKEEEDNNKCQLIYSQSDPTPMTPLVWIPYFGMNITPIVFGWFGSFLVKDK